MYFGGQERVSEAMASLARCNRLAELTLGDCSLSQPSPFAQLPKSITKLKLFSCGFDDSVDWSFLVGSGVQELVFKWCRGVDGKALGGELAVCLRTRGLETLHFDECSFTNGALTEIGVGLGYLKKLVVERIRVNKASMEQISLALQSPNNQLRELKLPYDASAAVGIETILMQALKHPNCGLTRLDFAASGVEWKSAARVTVERFEKRRELFALLQGQQVRRLGCPLRRLPVEMMRLVAQLIDFR
jgi:hypothetical protein